MALFGIEHISSKPQCIFAFWFSYKSWFQRYEIFLYHMQYFRLLIHTVYSTQSCRHLFLRVRHVFVSCFLQFLCGRGMDNAPPHPLCLTLKCNHQVLVFCVEP
ncbi:hypothetical protein HOLleu_12116 [Holothuria leucospilota]|uniref:Uncharacterized protein n=1 Tax=Holothuria leucospilota TaxID=206669 RepID=A0A9Q1HDL8_HOLLE|nr:hypothetical protein HOLleu_12116 [Holothuria leucospilota]